MTGLKDIKRHIERKRRGRDREGEEKEREREKREMRGRMPPTQELAVTMPS